MSKLNNEQVKAESRGLRGPLSEDLASSDAFLSEAGKLLIKFHGSYEQTNRDKRGAAAREYIFMVRSKLPGGRLTRGAVPGARRHRDPARQRHAAHHDAAGHPVPRRRQGPPARHDPRAQSRPRDDVRRVRRRRPQRDVLPCPERRPEAPRRAAVRRPAVCGDTAEDEGLPPDLGRRRRPSSPTRKTRSTAPPTCRASSRSRSPSRATTAWTSSRTTRA